MINLLMKINVPFLFVLTCMVSKTTHCQEINIHSIHTLRQNGMDVGYTLNGGHMRGSRAKLLNTENFGPGSLYPKTIHITDAYLETESLCQVPSVPDIDIFFFGVFDKRFSIPFSAAEIDSMYNWSIHGGKMIICAGPSGSAFSFEPDVLNLKWGFDTEQEINMQERFLPTTEGAGTKIFNGPFGEVKTAYQGGGAQGYFTQLTSNSIILAKDLIGRPTLFIDCNTLDLVCVDVDAYTDLGGVRDNQQIITENDRFWVNTIAFMDSMDSQPSIDIKGNTLRVGDYAHYQWYFNGAPIDGANAGFITTENEGLYKVTITYSNGCGTASDSINFIRLNDAVWSNKIFVPNVITPNSDGKNDYLIIDSLPSGSELTIFNRIGNIVYKNIDYQNEWDGTDQNGEPLRFGTYWYILKIAGSDEELKGHVFIKK